MKNFVCLVLLAVVNADNPTGYSATAPAYSAAPAPVPVYSSVPAPAPAYSSVPAPAPSYAVPAAPAYSSAAYTAPNNPPSPYSFKYDVKDGPSYNDFGHSESSDGKTVTGSYHVLLPDGRTQIVTYKADSNGYAADVKYVNGANYPGYSGYKA